MSWFRKVWAVGKKLDPITHKVMEKTMQFDSKGVREVSKGLGKVTGVNAFDSLSREADKNVKDPVRGIGRAAATAGAIFGGMYLAGAGATAGAAGGASAGGAAAGGTGLTMGAGGTTGLTAGSTGLGMTAAGTAAGGTATGVGSTGLGASGAGAAAGGSSAMDWFRLANQVSNIGGGQQRQPMPWRGIDELPELDVPQVAQEQPWQQGVGEYFGGGHGA